MKTESGLPVFSYFNSMVESNIWHDRSELDEVIGKLKSFFDPTNKAWSWVFNTQCKYIDIRIDMRNGGFILKDRDGSRICIEQIEYQKNFNV